MKGKFAFVICLVLSVPAFAGSKPPVAVVTFACNGNVGQRFGTCPDGGEPDSIIQSSDGKFYGTAQVSMEGSSTPNGGSVFSLTPSGALTVLHTFAAGPNKNYPNGNLPGLLVEGPDGKLYGETAYGGLNGCNGYCGSGLLFRLHKDGSGFQVVHKYCSAANCGDGQYGGAILVGTDGNLYGTTIFGGQYNGGVIFRVTPSTGAYEVVFNFNVSGSGEIPSSLIAAKDGTFYGMSVGPQGQILFHLTEDTGTVDTTQLNFPNINGLPSRGSMLTLGPNGSFFGPYTVYGQSGMGMFDMNADGSNLQLFPFFTSQDGAGAVQEMLLATDGNFYLVDYDGTSGYGNIAVLSPTTGQILRTFNPFGTASALGAYPTSMIQASDGTFWGVTDEFGKVPSNEFADGTVFNANVGLPPR